jgi:hypothetical protein
MRNWKTRDAYVTVNEKMTTESADVLVRVRRGRYDVAVLTARRGAELARWLQAEGFAPPAGLEPVATAYLQRGWKFVAARVMPAHTTAAGPLPPLAVAFPAAAPVFPLAISRLSAPPRVLLRLVVEAPQPVRCTSLPEVSARQRGRLLLDIWRRQVCEEQGGRALVCEYVASEGWRDARPALVARTRYWALLDRAGLVDLEFAARAEPARMRAVEHLHRVTGAERWWLMWGGLALWWLFAALWLRRQEGVALDLAAGTALAAIMAVVGVAALPATALLLLWDAVTPVPAAVLTVTILALGCRRFARAGDGPWDARLAAALPLACAVGCLGVYAEEVRAAAVFARRGFEEMTSAPALAAAAAGFAVLAGLALPSFRPRLRAVLAGWAVAVPVIAALSLAVFAVPVPTEQDYVQRRGQLLAALEACRRDTRVLPARLSDLTATQAPATGVDGAGNAVPLLGAWRGPYLPQLPVDPLTGRRDTWRYEPTGDLLVDAAWPTDYEPGPKYSVW